MKRLLLPLICISLLFTACGGEDEKDGEKSESGPSICDCVNANGDEELLAKCKEKYPKPDSEEEMKKMMEKVEKCQKDKGNEEEE
jgi:hypothetical protein